MLNWRKSGGLPETKIGQLINITSAAFKVPKQTKFDEHWVTLLEVTRQQVTAAYGGNGTLQPNEFISWAHQQLLAASSEISSDINQQNDLEDSEAMGAIAEFVSDVSGEVSEFIGDVEWQATEQLSDLIASRLDKSRLLRASFVKAALKLGASNRQQKPSAMKIFRSAATAAIAPKDYTADVVIAALNGRL